MNDEHDNAQTDNEMIRNLLKKAQEGDPSVVVWGDIDIDLDEDEVTATIRASMSDLEIVNEIIRVAGYERITKIAAMLMGRWADVQHGG